MGNIGLKRERKKKQPHKEKVALSTEANRKSQFFLPMRQSLFCLSGAEKICLAHGPRQLTRDVKSDILILDFRSNGKYATTKNTE